MLPTVRKLANRLEELNIVQGFYFNAYKKKNTHTKKFSELVMSALRSKKIIPALLWKDEQYPI